MNYKQILSDNPWVLNIAYSTLAIIIGVLLYKLMLMLFFKKLDNTEYSGLLKGKKSNTYLRLIKSVSRYLFIIIILLVILRINGINITSVVTGVGVLGIVFGFAVQDALKDIIKGIDIITDSYYHVGDVIRVDKYTGKVLAIGIKTTRLQDVFENNIVSISNRNIEKVEILSHMINIDIPLPYDLKVSEAETAVKEITEEIKKLKKVENAEYRGINEFADSAVKYHIKVFCPPQDILQTRRDALTCIIKCLEDRNISIPFNQIDIHSK
ncbi:MAG: mechanosensitive ion channel family protein [Clostridia bacterium]|nr:mechanosensitive ion channel family protein [Clostridia bacterium]